MKVFTEKKDEFAYAYNEKEYCWQVIKYNNSVTKYHNTPEIFETKEDAIQYCTEMIIDWSSSLKIISPKENIFYVNPTIFPELYNGELSEKEIQKEVNKIVKEEKE